MQFSLHWILGETFIVATALGCFRLAGTFDLPLLVVVGVAFMGTAIGVLLSGI
jgi:hypothetical protein